jgi:hypothetical protein
MKPLDALGAFALILAAWLIVGGILELALRR